MTRLSKIVTKAIILLINVTVYPCWLPPTSISISPLAAAEVANSSLRTASEIYVGNFRAQRKGVA